MMMPITPALDTAEKIKYQNLLERLPSRNINSGFNKRGTLKNMETSDIERHPLSTSGFCMYMHTHIH